jgi:hypothetical protein
MTQPRETGIGTAIADGASWITSANRAAHDRRSLIEIIGADRAVGRLALNSGEDEDGKDF